MYLSRRSCVRSSQLSFKAAFKSPGNRWLLFVSISHHVGKLKSTYPVWIITSDNCAEREDRANEGALEQSIPEEI